MKRSIYILFAMILAVNAKGQALDSLKIIEIAKFYFRNNFVGSNLSETNSYEPVEIKSRTVSIKEKLEFDSFIIEALLNNAFDSTSTQSLFYMTKDSLKRVELILKSKQDLKIKNQTKFNKKYGYLVDLAKKKSTMLQTTRATRRELELKLKEYQKKLNNKNTDLTKIAQWRVYIDRYEEDRNGNKILKKYGINLTIDGLIDGNPFKLN